MSQKKRKKLKKLRIKKIQNPSLRKPDELIVCPYESLEKNIEDVHLMHAALAEFYGDIPENFSPPLYESDEHGLRLAGWVVVYRDLMLEKYKLLDLVEPRVKFNLMMLADSA